MHLTPLKAYFKIVDICMVWKYKVASRDPVMYEMLHDISSASSSVRQSNTRMLWNKLFVGYIWNFACSVFARIWYLQNVN